MAHPFTSPEAVAEREKIPTILLRLMFTLVERGR